MSIDMEIPPSDEQIEAAELQALSDEQQELEFINQNKNIMQTSIVTNVSPNGSFTNDHGVFYTFEYTFEDGTLGNANHKTDSPKYNVGDSATFTTEASPHGLKIKFVNPDFQQGQPNTSVTANPIAPTPQPNKPYVKPVMQSNGENINASVVCSYSKDLEAVYIRKFNGDFNEDRFRKNADIMLKWLNEKSN